MAPKRSKAQQPADSWLIDPQELPRADIELKDKTASRQKLYRVMVYGVMFGLFPLSLLANMAMMPKVLEFGTAAVAAPARTDSETKSAAMLAVTKWLAQSPSPLPGGSLLSWDGVDIQAEPDITVDKNNGQTIEKQGLQLHHMTVVSATGSVFSTTVQVAYSKVRGAQVTGDPTLIPKAPDDASSWPNLKSWPNLTKVGATDQMTQAAKSWVEAFTSADPEKLHHMVGDSSTDHSYVPLRGATASDVRIVDAGARLAPDASTDSKPSDVVARVSFAVKWDGQNTGAATTLSRVTYDVLIQKADTGSPVIVAWGGAGTGESLSPYSNAIDRKLSADGIAAAVPTATPGAPAPAASAPAAAKPNTTPTSVPTVGTLVPPAPPTPGK